LRSSPPPPPLHLVWLSHRSTNTLPAQKPSATTCRPSSAPKGVELDALKALPALLAVAYPVKYCSGMIALGRIDFLPLGSRSKILREVIG